MDEAERLCDRLVIMDSGKVLAEGAPRTLIETHVGQEVFELGSTAAEARAFLDGFDLSGTEHEHSGDVFAVFLREKAELSQRLVARARQLGARYLLRNASLEDVFLKLTGRELDE